MKLRRNGFRERPRKRCAGFTMIEAMCAVTVSSVLMVVCVAWIHQTMKYSSRVKELKQFDGNLSRLAAALRNDVRCCGSMALDEDTLTLNCFGGKMIAYEIDGNDLLVKTKKAGSPTKQEKYALPTRAIVRWDDAEMPAVIGLIVSRQFDPDAKPRRVKTAGEATNEDDRPDSEADDDSPIDLHIRVGGRRWAAPKKGDDGAEAGDEKEKAPVSQENK